MGRESVVITDIADVPDGGILYAVHVLLDGCDKVLRVTRTKIARKYGHKRDRRVFVKTTFPLMLVSLVFPCPFNVPSHTTALPFAPC